MTPTVTVTSVQRNAPNSTRFTVGLKVGLGADWAPATVLEFNIYVEAQGYSEAVEEARKAVYDLGAGLAKATDQTGSLR